jgi:hypothetical protein
VSPVLYPFAATNNIPVNGNVFVDVVSEVEIALDLHLGGGGAHHVHFRRLGERVQNQVQDQMGVPLEKLGGGPFKQTTHPGVLHCAATRELTLL